MPTFVIQSHRGVEQLVARRAHNPEAGGSSPSPATKNRKRILRNQCPFFLGFVQHEYALINLRVRRRRSVPARSRSYH